MLNDTPLVDYEPDDLRTRVIRFTLMEGDFKGHFFIEIKPSYWRDAWQCLNPGFFIEKLDSFKGDITYEEQIEGEGYYNIKLKDQIGTILTLRSNECCIEDRIVSIQIVE